MALLLIDLNDDVLTMILSLLYHGCPKSFENFRLVCKRLRDVTDPFFYSEINLDIRDLANYGLASTIAALQGDGSGSISTAVEPSYFDQVLRNAGNDDAQSDETDDARELSYLLSPPEVFTPEIWTWLRGDVHLADELTLDGETAHYLARLSNPSDILAKLVRGINVRNVDDGEKFAASPANNIIGRNILVNLTKVLNSLDHLAKFSWNTWWQLPAHILSKLEAKWPNLRLFLHEYKVQETLLDNRFYASPLLQSLNQSVIYWREPVLSDTSQSFSNLSELCKAVALTPRLRTLEISFIDVSSILSEDHTPRFPQGHAVQDFPQGYAVQDVDRDGEWPPIETFILGSGPASFNTEFYWPLLGRHINLTALKRLICTSHPPEGCLESLTGRLPNLKCLGLNMEYLNYDQDDPNPITESVFIKSIPALKELMIVSLPQFVPPSILFDAIYKHKESLQKLVVRSEAPYEMRRNYHVSFNLWDIAMICTEFNSLKELRICIVLDNDHPDQEFGDAWPIDAENLLSWPEEATQLLSMHCGLERLTVFTDVMKIGAAEAVARDLVLAFFQDGIGARLLQVKIAFGCRARQDEPFDHFEECVVVTRSPRDDAGPLGTEELFSSELFAPVIGEGTRQECPDECTPGGWGEECRRDFCTLWGL